MLNAVLFDIDNTLILFDEMKFHDLYFPGITPMFTDIMPADDFHERLITATLAMAKNNGERTNVEVFLDVFMEGRREKREDVWARFVRFYETEYDKIEEIVIPTKGAGDVFEAIRRMGLKLVIASNPFFPMEVQLKRVAWAGLDHFHFDLVTHIENMSFCKPGVEYYLQIGEMIDEPPEACLMVGNDPVNDMNAAKAGMKTYLTVDALDVDASSLTLSRGLDESETGEIPPPDFTGPLSACSVSRPRTGRIHEKGASYTCRGQKLRF